MSKRADERAGRIQHRTCTASVRKVEGNTRALTFTASTADVARDGDIIEVEGWQVADYLRNPVFLWMHDPYAGPIGKAVNVRVGDTLELDVEFDIDERSDDIYGKYDRGFLSAVSVGYLPKAYRKPDDEERAELGLGPWGVVWTKTDLLEVSAVSVPADPGALIQNDFTSFEDRVSRDQCLADAIDETRAEPDPDPVDLTETPDHSEEGREYEEALAARQVLRSPASQPAGRDNLDVLKALSDRRTL